MVIFDCLGKYLEALIYRNKGVIIYRHTKNTPRIDISKRKFIRCKKMVVYLHSLEPSTYIPSNSVLIFTRTQYLYSLEPCSKPVFWHISRRVLLNIFFSHNLDLSENISFVSTQKLFMRVYMNCLTARK